MSTTTPVTEKWTKGFPIVLIILAIGLVLSYLLISPLPVNLSSASVSTTGSNFETSLEADAARYTAMAEFYAAKAEHIQQGLEADAARYTAMAEFYNASAASIQHGLEADAARYTDMANYYMNKESDRLQRIHEALADIYESISEMKHYREHFIKL